MAQPTVETVLLPSLPARHRTRHHRHDTVVSLAASTPDPTTIAPIDCRVNATEAEAIARRLAHTPQPTVLGLASPTTTHGPGRSTVLEERQRAMAAALLAPTSPLRSRADHRCNAAAAREKHKATALLNRRLRRTGAAAGSPPPAQAIVGQESAGDHARGQSHMGVTGSRPPKTKRRPSIAPHDTGARALDTSTAYATVGSDGDDEGRHEEERTPHRRQRRLSQKPQQPAALTAVPQLALQTPKPEPSNADGSQRLDPRAAAAARTAELMGRRAHNTTGLLRDVVTVIQHETAMMHGSTAAALRRVAASDSAEKASLLRPSSTRYDAETCFGIPSRGELEQSLRSPATPGGTTVVANGQSSRRGSTPAILATARAAVASVTENGDAAMARTRLRGAKAKDAPNSGRRKQLRHIMRHASVWDEELANAVGPLHLLDPATKFLARRLLESNAAVTHPVRARDIVAVRERERRKQPQRVDVPSSIHGGDTDGTVPPPQIVLPGDEVCTVQAGKASRGPKVREQPKRHGSRGRHMSGLLGQSTASDPAHQPLQKRRSSVVLLPKGESYRSEEGGFSFGSGTDSDFGTTARTEPLTPGKAKNSDDSPSPLTKDVTPTTGPSIPSIPSPDIGTFVTAVPAPLDDVKPPSSHGQRPELS